MEQKNVGNQKIVSQMKRTNFRNESYFGNQTQIFEINYKFWKSKNHIKNHKDITGIKK